jgi:hypothetical protein
MKYIGEIKFYVVVLLTSKFSRIWGRLIPVILVVKIMYTTHQRQLADKD